MEQVVTNLQHPLSSEQLALQQFKRVTDAQQASAAQRENALQARLADLSDRLNLNIADADLGVDPGTRDTQTQSLHRVSSILEVDEFRLQGIFVQGFVIQVREHGRSRGPVVERVSWMGSSTGNTNNDYVEAGPDSVEIDPQVYAALAELLEGEALNFVQNTAQGAGLQAWWKLVIRVDPQTVGRESA